MNKGQVIATIIGAVLGVIICLVVYYWDKENKK